MAIFPYLECESVVQVGDRFRLDASKSYVNGGSAAISSVDFALYDGATVITSTSADPEDWIEDTQYEYVFDVTSANDKIDFKEGSGPEITATLAHGNYAPDSLASTIETALEAAGALGYTVSFSTLTYKFTISADSDIILLGETGSSGSESILPAIGFDEDTDGSSNQVGDEVESVTKLITVTAHNGTLNASYTKTVSIISAFSDRLWSTDAQLRDHEPDILKWVQAGRNSYLNVHRLAQNEILAWMDRQGFVDLQGNKFTKKSFVLVSELAQWSKFVALRLIFDGISNQVDDVFFRKARAYEGMEVDARNRAVLRLDLDNDGAVNLSEVIDIKTTTVLRR